MTSRYDHRFPGMTFADLRTELDRTEAASASDAAAAIAKGAMTKAAAAHQTATVDALREDIARFAAAYAPLDEGRPMAIPPPPAHAISWRDRRAFLKDELLRRQRVLPPLIAKGQTTAPIATRQFNRLAALLALYEDGHDFPPDQAYADFFQHMLNANAAGARTCFRLCLDITPPAESFPQKAAASGRPQVAKGPNHANTTPNRSRHSA